MAESPLPEGLTEAWGEFLKGDHMRSGGLDFYSEVFCHPLLFPLQRPKEMARMMRMARSLDPITVMEVGTDKGGGAYHWLKCLPGVTRFVGCELRGVPYGWEMAKAFPGVETLWLGRSSYDSSTVADVKAWLKGEQINVLFLDGDKLEFLRDFECYEPLMSRPGLVFLHDIQDNDPGRVFRTLIDRGYDWEVILDRSEGEEAARRAKAGEPPRNNHDGWLMHWKGRSCGVGVIKLKPEE